MSYSIFSQCSLCDKKSDCTDLKEIEKAVIAIHFKGFEDGHKGGGVINLHCVRQSSSAN
jgi:hypothetical protein